MNRGSPPAQSRPRKEEDMEDQQIIQKFYERQEQALKDLSNKYGTLCQAIANRILSNQQDAEEYVNDVLLGNLEEANGTYYLCNLKEKTYMTIDLPSELKENVEIYIAAKEGKILLTDGKEAYLVDVKNLGQPIPYK